MLWLQQSLHVENRFLISKSIAIEKRRTNLGTLINALYFNLTPGKQVKIPTQGERRDRKLQKLVRKRKKPVALFVDNAHELRCNILNDLKLLIEVIADGGGQISIVLAGHPRLHNDQKNPNLEKIGCQLTIYSLDAITSSQREYDSLASEKL